MIKHKPRGVTLFTFYYKSCLPFITKKEQEHSGNYKKLDKHLDK